MKDTAALGGSGTVALGATHMAAKAKGDEGEEVDDEDDYNEDGTLKSEMQKDWERKLKEKKRKEEEKYGKKPPKPYKTYDTDKWEPMPSLSQALGEAALE